MIFDVTVEQDFQQFYDEITSTMKMYLADIVDFVHSILADYFSENVITVLVGAVLFFIVLTIFLKAINHK